MQEDQHTEFKEGWRDEYLKWIAAFANAQGGTLIVGVNDNGVPVGLSKSKQLLEELPNKVRDQLGIMVDVSLKVVGGHEVIYIEVPALKHAAVSYKGTFPMRVGSTVQILNGRALSRFLLEREGSSWELQPMPNLSIEDLSQKAVDEYKALVSKVKTRFSNDDLSLPNDQLLNKLNLINGKQLLRAAILLFHTLPSRFFRGAFVQVGYFDYQGNIHYQDLLQGDIISQAINAVDLIVTKYLKAYIKLVGIQRTEHYPIPIVALREAILNAVVHRDYSIGDPIQIKVYENQLMIWNPGRLPEGWTIDTLLSNHGSTRTNPTIAEAFRHAGLIESWGRGIEVIVKSCKEEGTTVYFDQVGSNGFVTTFLFESNPNNRPLPELIAREADQDYFYDSKEIRENSKETIENNKEIRENGDNLPGRKKEIRDLIKEECDGNNQNSESNIEFRFLSLLPSEEPVHQLANQLGITEQHLRQLIANMRQRGLVSREGSTKKPRWIPHP